MSAFRISVLTACFAVAAWAGWETRKVVTDLIRPKMLYCSFKKFDGPTAVFIRCSDFETEIILSTPTIQSTVEDPLEI